MKRIVKQVAAIDVAQDELVVCLGRMYDDWSPELIASKIFKNDKKGISAFFLWTKKLMDSSVPVRFVMEATGIYHEALAYFLDGESQQVSVVLPNKISNFMRRLDVKTITDRTASEAIARFGLERHLDTWKRPKEIFRKMRQLTRERDQIVQERTVLKNQLHAEEVEAFSSSSTLTRIKARIKLLDKHELQIKEELAALVASDAETKAAVKLISSITGIGSLTATTVLAETNGFELIRNKRQLASYAGFDVREKQSGTSVKGKPRISKKGNKHLRKAMHRTIRNAAIGEMLKYFIGDGSNLAKPVDRTADLDNQAKKDNTYVAPQ